MSEPIDLGSERQLFIDDYCTSELCGVRRRFHQARKHPANPLMTPEGWEKDIQAYGNVLYDPDMKCYRMWYNARYDRSIDKGFAICHAFSKDGMTWERTPLNRIESNGKVLSNAVLIGYLRGPTVFFTPDDPDPARRYRMFLHSGGYIVGDDSRRPPFTAGYSVLFSPDGYDWTPCEDNPVMQGGDIATCMYDPVTKDYIAFPKIHNLCVGPGYDAVVNANDCADSATYPQALAKWNRRCVGVSASQDFVTWGTPEIHLAADAIDDGRVASRLERFRDLIIYDDPEFYSADMQGMTGFRYEGLRLGLIWFYDRSAARPREFGGNDDGILNIQLAYTRDADPYGFWHRAGDRYDFIPCGVPGEHDCGMIFASHTVVERDDDLLFYYTGYSYSHGNWGPWGENPEPNKPLVKSPIRPSSINLATLRRDGFASIDGLSTPGSMTTKLLTFQGERLEVNADAENGYILVELTDRDGNPIPGYTKEECVPFCSDEIRGEIEWKGGKDLSALQGQAINIAFHMQTARLYSFTVKGESVR